MSEVTQILSRIDSGDATAADLLLPLVYDELRKLAAARLSREEPGQTLQATALVHDAYLRLVGTGENHQWNSRGHFFGAAAEAMRRILIEQARRKNRLRHGGRFERVDLNEACSLTQPLPDDLLDLDDALSRLEAIEPVRANLVKLRFFAGLTVPEAANALGISVTTAERYWRVARTWLYAEISGES